MSKAPILIIDDSETVRKQVQVILQEKGHSVIQAADGLEALERLKENPKVRLAVCDIHMPNMDGLEFLQTVHDSGSYPELRIVMLTTSGKPKLIRAARDAGAKGWLVKPFKPNMLLATIERLLQA